jgi:hypothetical protein
VGAALRTHGYTKGTKNSILKIFYHHNSVKYNSKLVLPVEMQGTRWKQEDLEFVEGSATKLRNTSQGSLGTFRSHCFYFFSSSSLWWDWG